MNEMLPDERRVGGGGALKTRFAGCGLASCKKGKIIAARCPKKRTSGVVS